jgi:hypothetical protein
LEGQSRAAPDPDRWEVVFIGGLPGVRPPVRVDPERKPRFHQRFRLRLIDRALEAAKATGLDPGQPALQVPALQADYQAGGYFDPGQALLEALAAARPGAGGACCGCGVAPGRGPGE